MSPDHIHLLLAAPPILAPAKLAQYSRADPRGICKRNSQNCASRIGDSTCGRAGYFCATSGAVDEATIKAYIKNQKWDEDDEGFKITASTRRAGFESPQ